MTKINWKHLATTKGYKSLKAEYIKYVTTRHTCRNKQEYLKHFNWVICRAKHYAEFKNITIETILNIWESKRTYRWLNYYGNSRQPKLNKHPLVKPMGMLGHLKYYKNDVWVKYASKRQKKERILGIIDQYNKSKKTGKKARWPEKRKKI